MNFDENCECGWRIPMGYGYYNFGKPVECLGCGKINQKESEIEKYANTKDEVKKK